MCTLLSCYLFQLQLLAWAESAGSRYLLGTSTYCAAAFCSPILTPGSISVLEVAGFVSESFPVDIGFQ